MSSGPALKLGAPLSLNGRLYAERGGSLSFFRMYPLLRTLPDRAFTTPFCTRRRAVGSAGGALYLLLLLLVKLLLPV